MLKVLFAAILIFLVSLGATCMGFVFALFNLGVLKIPTTF